MNYVVLSPHFPRNYVRFSTGLRRAGATVLGVGDEPWEKLPAELKETLAEYYRVDDMHDYDGLVRAMGFLTHRHGKIDGIDSFNEYWLQTEARLRTDFNVEGVRTDRIMEIKRKSRMKEVYRRAGIEVAPGAVVGTLDEARRLIGEIGYPIVAKPDIGVGAAGTRKIHTDAELERFFAETPWADHILERFVPGQIVTFDGLADRDGNLVFTSSLVYSDGIMETVNEDRDVFYYTVREIPGDLLEAGQQTARAFGVRGRFFHFEFFRAEPDGRIVALEVNMRPPGGLTTDMFNYANDFDIYAEWANVVVKNRFEASWSRPYCCLYASRKKIRRYARSHEQLLAELGPLLVHHEPIDGVFRQALGDHGYLFRSPELDEVLEAARLVHETA